MSAMFFAILFSYNKLNVLLKIENKDQYDKLNSGILSMR